jgi:hypothetical protein
MSSSSSSSDSRSDSDDDEITKQRKKDKFRAKVMRRQKRSELENIEEEKKREIRLQQMKHQREYLEMKRKKEAYQRFLLERQRNPNKEPIVSLLATIRNKKIKNNAASRSAKNAWYNMSPPIQIGEKQNETPTIKEWRQMMGLSEPTPKSRKKLGGHKFRRKLTRNKKLAIRL